MRYCIFFKFFAESPYFEHKAKRMNLEQLAQELRLLIAQGETDEAIDRLLRVYNQTKGEYYDELIVIASHHKMLRDKIMAGAIEADDAAAQRNAINHSLLQLIDHLDEDEPLRRHFKVDDAKMPDLPDFKPKPKSNNRNLFIGIGIVVVLIVGFFLLSRSFGNRDQTAEAQTEQQPEAPVTEESTTPTERNTPQPPRDEPTPSPTREEDAQQPEEPPVENDESAETTAPASLDAEPNNTIAQALALTFPADQKGTISTASDRDHFKITLQARQRIEVLLEATDAELNPILEVLDASGNSLQRLSARDGKITTFHQVRNTGDYYLRIYGRLRSTGSYRLRARVE